MKADPQSVHEPEKQSPSINAELQRAAINEAPVTDVPPSVHEVLQSPGQPLDAETRAFFEPRFGHDFSGVRVHTDAKAAESARAVNARAYTVGQEVVLGAPYDRAGTSSNRSLLAHELTHTLQQQSTLDLNRPIEIGAPGDRYERDAGQAAESIAHGQIPTMAARLPVQPRIQRQSVSNPQGDEQKSSNSIEELNIPPAALSSAQAALLDWLKVYKRNARKFFDDIWTENDIILLGEIHDDDVQRKFAADMLAARGGHHVGLALEIAVSQQEEVNYYIQHGTLPKDANGWWKNQPEYKKIIEAAARTGTKVIAMDSDQAQASKSIHDKNGMKLTIALGRGQDRDTHMADTVTGMTEKSEISKVLVYVGSAHIREGLRGTLGNLLGGKAYAIRMFHPENDSDIYWLVQKSFPTEKSIGFDVDESPLAISKCGDEIVEYTCGGSYDGFIFFRSSADY